MAEPAPDRQLATKAAAGRYNNLILFWAVIVAVFAGGAIILQTLGPLKPGAEDYARITLPPLPPSPAKSVGIPAPDPTLLENAADFPGRSLPQIGAGNRTPATAYAAPFDASDKHPRVALVIAGAGLDQAQTLHLLNELPGAIDVAFSPYMPEESAEQNLSKARATGHECLQSIPMEPSGFPLSEEGGHALLTGVDSEQNRQNLEWALTRAPGCVGATGASDGLMGERFAQTGLGFAAVLAEIGKRGLLYLDPRTGAPALTDAPAGTYIADLVIDAAPTGEEQLNSDLIDRRLALLEKLAAEHGSAIGLAGPPRPILLERVAIWAHGLAARGISLAPLSAIQAPAPRPAEEQ